MKENYVDIADRVMEYCIYGIVFFIPISSAIVEALACVGIAFFLIKKILRPDFKSLISLSHIFLFLFIFFSVLSMSNSGVYLKKSFNALFFKWLEYAAIFLVAEDAFLTGKFRFRNVAFIFLIGASLAGISGLSQRLFDLEFIRHRELVLTDNKLAAITGPFRHFNSFGVYLVVSLSMAIALILSNKLKMQGKVLLCNLIGLLVVCLLFTFSRGNWIAFIFILILPIFLSRGSRFLIILPVVFVFFLISLPGVNERSVFSLHLSNSFIWNDADRFKMWGTAFKMIKENPFLGKGIGTFMAYFCKYRPEIIVQYAHNCYLQIWAETGIFSLLSFLFFTGSLLYQGVKKFKENSDFVLLGLVCAIFGFLIHSFFDTDLYSVQLSILFWTFMGLLAAKIKVPAYY